MAKIVLDTFDDESSFAVLTDGTDSEAAESAEAEENADPDETVDQAVAEIPPSATGDELDWSAVATFLLILLICFVGGIYAVDGPSNRFSTQSTRTSCTIPACHDGWTVYQATGKCYKRLPAMPFYEAQFKCSAMGGNLTSSEQENRFLTDFATSGADENRYAWIGLHNPRRRPSEWLWIDSTVTGLADFKQGKPDTIDGMGFCTVVKTDLARGKGIGTWLTDDCNAAHHPAICSKPAHFR